MARAYFTLSIIALLTAACGDDTAASSSATGTTTSAATTDVSTTAEPTSEPGTTSSPGTDPSAGSAATTTASTTSPGTTGPDTTTTGPDTTTTGPDTTTGTTGPDTTTTTDTTGGPGLCGVDGDSIDATLAKGNQPPPCGPLEFTGTRISDAKGPVWQLDGCACGATCLIPDPWSFTVEAPGAWLPSLPACPRIVVERAMGFGVCEFRAVSIWDLDQPGAPAVYHAGHGFGPTQAGAAELTITPHSLGTCECVACCGPDELWDLQFTFAGADLTLSEGESGKLGQHDAIDFESHQSGLCDAPSDIHWAVRLPG